MIIRTSSSARTLRFTIGVDGSRAFLPLPTGTENYSYQLVKALAKISCQDQVRLYLGHENRIDLEKDPWLKESFLQVKRIGHQRFWTQGSLAWETWKNQVDALFVPAHVIPFLKDPRVPFVLTVHDLPLKFFPHQQTWLQRIYLSRPIEKARTALASKIIAVSQATKRDLVDKLGVDPQKIAVIYEGVDEEKFQIPNSKLQINEIREKYGVKGDYFLFVGTLQPRKNLVRLIEAYGLLVKSSPSDPSSSSFPSLLICGKNGWGYEPIFLVPKRLGLQDKVIFTDFVDQSDLPALYANSLALVYPSLHEGFGLPILEAFAAETLVLTSNVSSLPEVAGSEAIYVNPLDVQDIARGLGEILEVRKNSQALSTKIEKAKEWAKSFTWERAAKETLETLRQTALENKHA